MPKQYSARMIMRSAGQTMTMRVYVDNGKTRTEMEMPKIAQNFPGPKKIISIARPDRSVFYIVIPATKSYEERPLNSKESQLAMASDPATPAQVLGTETVNGKLCTKYRMTHEGSSGLMWIGKLDGLPVRFEMEGSPGGIMDFEDVRVGPQPAALFEVPQGYTRGTGMGLLLPGMAVSGGAGSQAQVQQMMQGLMGSSGGQGTGMENISPEKLKAVTEELMKNFEGMIPKGRQY